jgi:hypothetical protein
MVIPRKIVDTIRAQALTHAAGDTTVQAEMALGVLADALERDYLSNAKVADPKDSAD